MVLQNDIDLLNPPTELEKMGSISSSASFLVPILSSWYSCPVRLVSSRLTLISLPDLLFLSSQGCQMPGGCFTMTTVFSHSQTVVMCPSCQTVLCQPTGGKTEGFSFRRKFD